MFYYFFKDEQDKNEAIRILEQNNFALEYHISINNNSNSIIIDLNEETYYYNFVDEEQKKIIKNCCIITDASDLIQTISSI